MSRIDDKQIAAIYRITEQAVAQAATNNGIKTSTGEVATLTDDEVAEAVVAGSHNDSPESIGLYLNDISMNVASSRAR